MNNDQQFWIGTCFAVVLMVLAAVIQVGLTTGWTEELLLQGLAFSMLGLAGVYIVRMLLRRISGTSPVGVTRGKVTHALIFLVLVGVSGYALMLATRTRALPEPAHEASDPVTTLAAQLSRREWALDGESCERDGIRFMVESNELVAYPMGSEAIRFTLAHATGQQLSTYRNGSPVRFEIREDGFTYFEGGQARWYQRCD